MELSHWKTTKTGNAFNAKKVHDLITFDWGTQICALLDLIRSYKAQVRIPLKSTKFFSNLGSVSDYHGKFPITFLRESFWYRLEVLFIRAVKQPRLINREVFWVLIFNNEHVNQMRHVYNFTGLYYKTQFRGLECMHRGAAKIIHGMY